MLLVYTVRLYYKAACCWFILYGYITKLHAVGLYCTVILQSCMLLVYTVRLYYKAACCWFILYGYITKHGAKKHKKLT